MAVYHDKFDQSATCIHVLQSASHTLVSIELGSTYITWMAGLVGFIIYLFFAVSYYFYEFLLSMSILVWQRDLLMSAIF